jgi:hypothetical protein
MLWKKTKGANFDNVLITNTKIQSFVLKFYVIKIVCHKCHEKFNEHTTSTNQSKTTSANWIISLQVIFLELSWFYHSFLH